ncbi:MAG: serine/threonine-protein kinase PknK [Spirochaetes bacterium]|nr:serine/threonine-protein kinase PknK [Spirochaetota bacterium]
MNPQTIPAQVPGFDIEEEIYASSHTRILRGYRQLDRLPVIVKILQATDPTQVQLVQFDNEAEFTRDLDIPGVRKALGTARLESLHALALEYVPGRTLRLSFVEQRRGLGEFLDIAIQLAGILGELHNRHIIHRDINPNNIIVDESSTPRAHLIDFGIASRLSLRLSNLGNPDHLEGSLPYISPEQTGRMNRAVDYRTDLYSLGVTLYEMLAGNLPFEAHDAMEWVHAHMARTPAALGPGVPPALAGIIAKLLAKNAEDRYQSAFGLKYDLEQVHAGLNDFALARRDYSGRFLLPQKLYGRARETAALLEAFDRAAAGRNGAELLLVTGSAGVGKSALVYETHKPITAARGHFIQGKFDQFQRNVPYVALVQAFDGFVRLLMTNSDIELRSWREKLQEAAGNIGKVLTDLVPSLELLIGAQPDVPVLDGSAAQNRFHYAFKNLVRSMASPEHPLVLFIDDWQWADLPSINMLETLLSDKDIRNLLVIAAYRDNEVDAGHPLTAAIENIQREGAPVQRITLQNLSTADVHALAGDALKGQDEDPDGLSDLARLVYEKTGGNAFFVGQFLKTLYEEKCLTFDFTLLAWQWDMDHIRTRGLTDNVVDLLSRQVLKLPPETRKVLQFAACIGNHFTPAHVSVIAEQEMEEANQALAPAVMEGLLVPNHIHFQNMTGQGLEYQFVHDRVQQAAYALIPEDEKQELHLQIGRLMLVKAEIHHGEINETYEQLFEIVNSLNKGANLITDSAERLILARLNLTAGNRAKTSTAYAPALAYYQAGMSLLPEEGWEREYDLTLALHRAAAEAAFLSGDFAKTDELTDTALIQARTILDKVPLYDVQIQAQNARNNPLRGIEIGLSTLRALGISLPMKPSKIRIGAALLKTKFLLRNRSFEELLELPMMTRPAAIAAMRLLSLISATVYTRAPDLLPLTSLTMVSLAVRYGQSPQSPYLYAGYGMISGSVLGEIDRGY